MPAARPCVSAASQGTLLDGPFGGHLLQHVDRDRALGRGPGPAPVVGRGYQPPGPLPVVLALDLLEEAVLGQLPQMVRGQPVADAHLPRRVRGGGPAQPGDDLHQVEPQRMSQSPDRQRVVEQPPALPGLPAPGFPGPGFPGPEGLSLVRHISLLPPRQSTSSCRMRRGADLYSKDMLGIMHPYHTRCQAYAWNIGQPAGSLRPPYRESRRTAGAAVPEPPSRTRGEHPPNG